MKKATIFLLLFLVPALFSTCERFEIKPITKVETGEATPFATSISVKGEIIDLSGVGNTDHGFCYSTHGEPTIGDDKLSQGKPQVGEFTASIEGLDLATPYFVRAYCQAVEGVVYGKIISITTLNGQSSVATTAASTITATTAISGGNITSDGGAPIVARGVVWSTSQNPTIEANQDRTIDGSGLGNFSSNLTGLSVNTTYCVRAYATNSVGTVYGSQHSFTTQDGIIALFTTAISSITATTAMSGGSITSDGGAPITARGVVWSTSQNPTIEANQGKILDGSGLGSFTSNLTGLLVNTNYFIRAYATNSLGTVYGSQHSFTTQDGVIALITTAISSITATTAMCGGNITSDGGSPVTARGVVWSISQNPTVDNNDGMTSAGSGLGNFTVNLTNLAAGNNYYVRAYATNSFGTQYGNQPSFSTPAAVTDADGNNYNTIWISGKQWFKENLLTTKYNDGTIIPLVTNSSTWEGLSTPAYCWYENNQTTYGNIYGALYNWYAVNTGKLCPIGWHVPTDSEWTQLINSLGGEDVGGGKLKEAGTVHWNSPNTGATDEVGFTALPGGHRFNEYGDFKLIRSHGIWWSATAKDASFALGRWMYDFSSAVQCYDLDKKDGFSVRCLKD